MKNALLCVALLALAATPGVALAQYWENSTWPQPQQYNSPIGTAPIYDYGYGANSYARYNYDPNSYVRSAPYRIVYGSSGYDRLGLQSEVSRYGSGVSPYSWRNSLTRSAPRLYNSRGEYRGRLSTNELDPESISNPLGRYGSEVSPNSVNSPYGYGNDELYIVPDDGGFGGGYDDLGW